MGLAEIVNGEAEKLEKPEEKDKVEEPETPQTGEENEGSTEQEEEETTSEAGDLTEDEIKEARNLYKALKDPESAKAVIAALAEKTGLSKVDSKTEVKESKKGIIDILKNALGSEFEFLAVRLGPAIEEVLNEERKERQASFQKIEAQRVESEVISVFKDLEKRTNGESKKLETKMIKLSEEILPGPNTTVKQYVNQLYTLASSGKQVSNEKKVIDKIKQNSNDTSGRLRAAGGNAQQKELPPGKLSLDKAVDSAFEQLSKGKG